jgi:C-6 monooxygenase
MSTPDITRPDAEYVALISFRVDDAESQRKLVDAVSSEVERWIRQRPGFVSAHFHLSTDGTRVVNYSQWTSEDAYSDFQSDPNTEVLQRVVAAVPGVREKDWAGYRLHLSVVAPMA